MIHGWDNLNSLTLAAAEPVTWTVVGGWVAIAGVVLAVLGATGCLRGATLRRGPLREVDLSGIDLIVGFALVGMIYLGKLVLGLGEYFVDWPENVELAVQQAAGLALIAGSLFFFAKAYLTDAGLRKAGFVPRQPGRDLAMTVVGTPVAVVLTFATLVAVNGVATAAGHPSPEVNHGMLEQLEEADAATIATIATIIIAAVVVGPLLEEIVFRGLLQTLLLEVFGRNARWTAILIASAVFAVVHLGATSWHALPGLFVLGLALGWMYERTGSLLPVYLVHAAFNSLNIAMVLAQPASEAAG